MADTDGKRFVVYILRSVPRPDKYYVGFTTDLKRRVEEHKQGSQVYSHRYAPWRVATYVVSMDQATALTFEKYLKSSSGKAFLRKRLVAAGES